METEIFISSFKVMSYVVCLENERIYDISDITHFYS